MNFESSVVVVVVAVCAALPAVVTMENWSSSGAGLTAALLDGVASGGAADVAIIIR